MIDQMLLELFSQFGAENFQVFSLFARLLIDLHNLFIDVSAEEVSPLRRVLLCLFDFFQNLADVAILALLDCCDLVHHVLEQVLHKLFGFLIAVHALIHLHTDHLAKFVCYLELTALEPINFILDCVIDFGHFCAQDDFLLGSGHLFLPNPAVDAPYLSLQVRVKRLDSLVFSLELIADICIHLVAALAHLLNTLSALFALHALFKVHLVAHVIDLTGSLLLLAKQAIHEIRDLNLQSVLHIVLQRGYHVPEVIVILEIGDLQTANVLLLLTLLHTHHVHILLEAHEFALDALEDLIEEHRRSVTLSVHHLVV